MSSNGWIGVDLDGTIARYDGWQGPLHIGNPIYLMVERVRAWVAAGQKVKIFTARVSTSDIFEREQIRVAIQNWLEEQGLPRLDVTCIKDYQMIQLWDDRAVQVVFNTGIAVERHADTRRAS